VQGQGLSCGGVKVSRCLLLLLGWCELREAS